MKRLIILFFLITTPLLVQSQVIISLLLGDKLNSGTVEFGLEGGLNYVSIENLEGKTHSLFNIGFYFDIKTKNPKWMVATGVKVKAALGTAGLPVYYLNDAGLDSSFVGGEVERKINYFNVPLMMKYKLSKHFFAEGGIMPSLRYTAYDIFTNDINDNEVTYKTPIKDQLHQIDFGIIGGMGYRLMGGNGMNLKVQYYYGLTDITKDGSTSQYNRSLYLSLGIPIGAAKAREREKKKTETPVETPVIN